METDPKNQNAPAPATSPFTSLQREIERVFDDFSRGWPFRQGAAGLSPRVDMKETDGRVEITAELPGMEEKDIDVAITGRDVRITGEKKSETRREDGDYHLMERSYGRFARNLTLPFEPEADKVKATFRNGVLTLSVPKPAASRSDTRKIEVKPGQ
ncbi:Hsp20/alpha crystallin family protein [Limibaculum sp. M0105]|uniref:Hsp20/alpha crystallin family protein n=1 Tax=Thermohalobaculum xanthum TaxID=2753746 RepID=A0A8J7M4Y3_9RHOB|nr:Hsp20/alpha crystallin family protein [Thermohalobaculum xanthum]MBK0398449.1 Hsp20/alpha crystallin family protein [Thermohalobaculum xanthum]